MSTFVFAHHALLTIRARAKVLADFENAFDDAASGPSGSFGGRGMGGGFVRAGGAPVGPKATIPVGPSQPPRGPSALGYARVRMLLGLS